MIQTKPAFVLTSNNSNEASIAFPAQYSKQQIGQKQSMFFNIFSSNLHKNNTEKAQFLSSTQHKHTEKSTQIRS
jgi:hypothetical protein